MSSSTGSGANLGCCASQRTGAASHSGTPKRSAAVWLALTIALVSTGDALEQSQRDSLSVTEDAELRRFFSLFPEIDEQLGDHNGSICTFCGCISIGCSSDVEANNLTTVHTLILEPPTIVAAEPAYEIDSCPRKSRLACSASAFDVVLNEPAFPSLPNLTSFMISKILLTGSLQQLLNNVPTLYPRLQNLHIEFTELSGPLPSSWFQPHAMTRLHQMEIIDNSQLTGQIPDLHEDILPSLTLMRVVGSPLNSTLPVIGRHRTTLEPYIGPHGLLSGLWVDFSRSNIRGTLPPSFGIGSGMSSLKLSENELTGTLPAEWGELGHFGLLFSLDLSSNNLTGTLPQSWEKGIFNVGLPAYAQSLLTPPTVLDQIFKYLLSNTSTIDVASNRLTGSVPEGFGSDVRFNTVTKLHAAPGNDGPDGLCSDTSPGNSTNQDPDPCEIWDIESFYYLNIT